MKRKISIRKVLLLCLVCLLLPILPIYAIAYVHGYNSMVEECNIKTNYCGTLDKMDEQLDQVCMNMWATYEANCPEIYAGILNNSIPIMKR